MGTFIFKRKFYSQYDNTDRLKQMKDSDILAEKQQKNPSLTPVAGKALGGVLTGAAVGATAGAVLTKTKGLGFKGGAAAMGKNALKKGKAGAIIGGTILAAKALKDRSKEKEETEFYNDRLEYAQHQAARREKADWKQNMTQRDGYSY